MFLGLASIFSGFYLSDLIIGNGTDFFIFNYNNIVHNVIDFHIGTLHINLLGLYYSIFGIIWILIILNKNNHYIFLKLLQPTKYINGKFKLFNLNLKKIFMFFSYRWYINFIYNELIALPTLKLGFNFIFLILDQGYILYLAGQMYMSNLSTKYTSYSINITTIKIINELFLLLFLSFFFLSWFISTDIITTIIAESNYIDIIILFFAVPKKRTKKNKTLKKKIMNKSSLIRRTNVKSVHFDEFFNNLPKWDSI